MTQSPFEIGSRCPHTKARSGLLRTGHGEVPTPAFMPVGTQGSVKTLAPDDLHSLGASIILANTYHLMLRPGVETIERLGGLHRFMAWNGPLLTDSGGFQVFSLGHLRRLDDEGVLFRSHLDGSEYLLTPERATELQERLGADIIMALDECPPIEQGWEETRLAIERTQRWAERCRRAQRRPDQLLFGIVQGGADLELRRRSVAGLRGLDFPGYAIGGLSLGEPKALTWRVVEATVALLPQDRPRYLMGVGSPEDLVEGVARGIDLFDCALPTRLARNGGLLTRQGRLNIANAAFRHQEGPVEPTCDCYTCGSFSVAYLNHLFRARELLAYRLATIHNLRFVIRLMEEMRRAIEEGTFAAYREAFQAAYHPTEEETRRAQKERWLRTQRSRFARS